MDIVTIAGLVMGFGFVLVGAIMEGLHLDALFGPTALLIVLGGTIGATVMSHTKKDFVHLIPATKATILPPKIDFEGTTDYLVGIAERARKNGILSLQDEVAKTPHPMIQRGLTMAVDGSDPDAVKEVLQSMIKVKETELHHAAAVMDTAGGYCPTIGILGTVMGLVHIMGNLSDPDSLGPAIAVAFLATLYGVGFANLIFLPLGSKIKLLAHQEVAFGELIIAGIIGLQSGENPRNLKERLDVLLGSHVKPGSREAKKAKGAAA